MKYIHSDVRKYFLLNLFTPEYEISFESYLQQYKTILYGMYYSNVRDVRAMYSHTHTQVPQSDCQVQLSGEARAAAGDQQIVSSALSP